MRGLYQIWMDGRFVGETKEIKIAGPVERIEFLPIPPSTSFECDMVWEEHQANLMEQIVASFCIPKRLLPVT